MLKLALIGKDIGHSRSQEMYEKLLKQKISYDLLDYPDENSIPPIIDLFKGGYKGISVTYPYKRTFLNQVKVESPIVEKVNAINCIGFFDGIVKATNTDFLAAQKLLQRFPNKLFIILGNGNMAKIFVTLFNELKIEFRHFYRAQNGDLNKVNFQTLKENFVLINCCSRKFIFEADLPRNTIFWDMNYSFEGHKTLKESKSIQYLDGLDLLLEQARFATYFWGLRIT